MIRHVIFDMDGVLTDSEPVINAAAIAGLREFGVEAKPEDFVPFVGMGEDRYIGGVAQLHGKPYVLDMKRRVYEIYLEILPDMIKAFPGVHDLLRLLQDTGFVLAVASSADRVKVEANLAAIAVSLDLFASVTVGEDVEAKKPAPDMYLLTASRLGAQPQSCCVVEDAVNGVLAAKAAGMRCVGVTTSFSREELVAAGADCVRDSLPELGLADLTGVEQ